MNVADETWTEAILERPMRPIEAAIGNFVEKISATNKQCRDSVADAWRSFTNSSDVVDRVYHAEIEQARKKRMIAIEESMNDPAGFLSADAPYYLRIQKAYRISQDSKDELERVRTAAIEAAKTTHREGIEAAKRHITAVIRREIEGAIRDAMADVFETKREE